eukprot:gene44006-53796_t
MTAGFGGGPGVPGGWTVVDPRDEDVQRIADFAVVTKYPEHKPQFLVVLAKKQVVAGLNYDLTVEVSSENLCRVDHFQVWDRFGELTLTQHDTLVDTCGSIPFGLRGANAVEGHLHRDPKQRHS